MCPRRSATGRARRSPPRFPPVPGRLPARGDKFPRQHVPRGDSNSTRCQALTSSCPGWILSQDLVHATGIFHEVTPTRAQLTSRDVSGELLGEVAPGGVCSGPHSSTSALGFFSSRPPTAACRRLSLSVSAVCTARLRWVKPAGADERNSLFPFLTPRESRRPLRSFTGRMAETVRITDQKNGQFCPRVWRQT